MQAVVDVLILSYICIRPLALFNLLIGIPGKRQFLEVCYDVLLICLAYLTARSKLSTGFSAIVERPDAARAAEFR